MAKLIRLELLGGFHAYLDDDPGGLPCRLPARKSEALLAYLATPTGRYHPRDKLAALLWGDTPDARARQSLRQALGHVRALAAGPLLLIKGDGVALDPAAVRVDAGDLEASIADGGTAALERAVELYQGEF